MRYNQSVNDEQRGYYGYWNIQPVDIDEQMRLHTSITP